MKIIEDRVLRNTSFPVIHINEFAECNHAVISDLHEFYAIYTSLSDDIVGA